MPKEKTTRWQVAHWDLDEKPLALGPVMCKEGKGVRNFACLNYDACLDKAAKAMWGGFTCGDCAINIPKDEESGY